MRAGRALSAGAGDEGALVVPAAAVEVGEWMVVGSVGVGSVVVARVGQVPAIPGIPAVQQPRVRLGVRLGLGSGLGLPLLATVIPIPIVTKAVVAVI